MNDPKLGELDHKVRIRRRTDVPDAFTDVKEKADQGLTRWAKVVPVGTAIHRDGQQVGDVVTHWIWIRRTEGIGADHVVENGGERYRVKRAGDFGTSRRFTRLDVELLGPA